MTIDDFAAGVLRELKAPRTRANMQAMRAWALQEGGHFHNSAKYNVYNTTMPAPGSATFRSVGQGAADIRIYKSEQQGIDATARTLKNGLYGPILSALRRGNNAAAVVQAVENSPWGTHNIRLNGVSNAPAPAGAGATAPTFHSGKVPSITPGTLSFTTHETPASDVNTRRASFLAALQQHSSSSGLPKLGHGSLLKTADYLFKTGQATEHVPTQYSSTTHATPTIAAPGQVETIRDGGATYGDGKFKISGPNPGRLKPELVAFARKVAAVAGETLTGLDGSTHSKYTVDGNISEHWTGNATDIPATGTHLVHLGQAALIAAGMPRKKALQQTGGLFNVGNHQIIFRTMQGGNHYDHLHISTHAR